MWLKANFEVAVYAYPEDKYLIVATGEATPLRMFSRNEDFLKALPMKVRLKSLWVRGQVAARDVSFSIADELGVSREEVKWLVS